MFDYEFDIPSNDDNVMRDGFHRLIQPAKMLTFEPHLHSSGKRMCWEALYPNNRREMLSCADYDHNWVKIYVYEDDAAPLPARRHGRARDGLVQQLSHEQERR